MLRDYIEMSKKVYILRGIPGSGKSSYVRDMVKAGKFDTDQVHVASTDDYFMKLEPENPHVDGGRKRRVYRFDPTLLPRAHADCMRGFLNVLNLGVEIVVVDNTNIHRWEYQNYELSARLAGYEVHIVEVMPLTVDELRVCAKRNTHGVPVDVVARMAMEFEYDTRAEKVRPKIPGAPKF